MKIEHLIVQHLYVSKQVTLQGIGTLRLDPSVVLPAENEKDKDFIIPDHAFKFEYNLKAKEDEALIHYIVQHTRKILPLASADLDSYVMLAKQFLNIGKPLVIEGVGTIQKNQSGEYQFIPGHFVSPKVDDIPRQLKEKKEEIISFETPQAESSSRRNLMIFVTLLVVAGTAFGIYYMVTHQSIHSAVPIVTSTLPKADTPIEDTVNNKSDTSAIANTPTTVTPPVNAVAGSFNIVLRRYNNADAADKAFKKFTTYGHKLVVINVDSSQYLLAMPFNTPLFDTTRARDSLKIFFGGNPFVKL